MLAGAKGLHTFNLIWIHYDNDMIIQWDLALFLIKEIAEGS